jgi:1,4-alpha-glucan branching enzyme
MAHPCRTPPLNWAQHRCQIHRFRPFVWAPGKSGVSVVIFSATEKVIVLEPRSDFRIAAVDALQGTRFMFRMPEEQNFADPASRFQPWGVDRPRKIVHTCKFRCTENFR